ncbi:MAG: hypothetical protein ACHP7P_12510 [Terriglobales bacterium]
MITIYVLVVTWKAIKRQAAAAEAQAEAARALTQVAKDQTKAAMDAAESARRQSDLLSSQIEQSVAPLLVAEPDGSGQLGNYKLVNRGPGVAFKIFYWRGELDAKNQGDGLQIFLVQPSTLGPGNSAHLRVPPDWEVFTVRYKGIDRAKRWTVVYRDPSKPQEHVVSKGLQELYLS